MKTLQECKDEVAKKHGFVSWPAMMIHHNLNTLSSSTISILLDELYELSHSSLKEENERLRSALKDAQVTIKAFLPDAFATQQIVESALSCTVKPEQTEEPSNP